MNDGFPLGYDREHHARLRRLYGDLVPPLERILVRNGLHGLVDELFSGLGCLSRRGELRVERIASRNAGFLELVTTGVAACAGDVVASVQEAARTTCEHCSGPARVVMKVGLEAALSQQIGRAHV